MHDNVTLREQSMPADMQVLLEQYPRESWESHPGFKDKTRQWLGAHRMFRQLAERIRLGNEAYLQKDIAAEVHARDLSRYGSALIGNLRGHHGWEDHAYFPELVAADARFSRGIAVLENDHQQLEILLETFTEKGNSTIRLAQLDERQATDAAGKLHDTVVSIETFLQRHLSDEEELAVPIILHHRLRG